ncbi:hypothetical protein RO3G_07638 [Lichtheimia corymbifera JMRC:FSU:9682]|uniref:BHLH domain-containing protein n=1 Tax=Lichtheimia corymbifera JMRC:FSU:9682 TaxID=1263082 RepID=A0A068S3R8_9FUNG|nr:hypothetical protein RO3G_07638 [Lichtheimia corymbifera JMRC:FSU:9682]
MTRSATAWVVQECETALEDRRSAHNALERQRREHLNARFQELARTLPSLQSVRRPSKSMIVSKSLDYVMQSNTRESRYVSEILDLRRRNEQLRQQAALLHSYKYPTSSSPPSSSSSSSLSLQVQEQQQHLNLSQTTMPDPFTLTPAMILSKIHQQQQEDRRGHRRS